MSGSDLSSLLAGTPMVPVLVIDSVTTAIPLARALVAGGLPILEITLRTKAALDVIRAIGEEVDGAVVGAGTVLTPGQLEQVAKIGARFAVSPGATETILDAARDSSVPLLPGTATASEVMRLLERGHHLMKFFPAEPAGGVAYLQALASPLPEARFCPTGGIDAERARTYLSLSNVVCVGGSWVAPGDAVRARDWARVRAFATEAAALRKTSAKS
jgi:2-dehydro-3-deoxyphosphogluconate aldolase/(4S)-4-hydroxy-2-oxoglutarate aldolase